MQSKRTDPPRPQHGGLVETLAHCAPDSAIAASRRMDFAHDDDDFVASLSVGAQTFLAQLRTPESLNRCTAAPTVPPQLGEELFVFADYALLDDLQRSALEAMMQRMTVPRALQLLLICCDTHWHHGPGYTALKHDCQAYLATHVCEMSQSPAYKRLTVYKRARVEAALHRHVAYVLQGGTRRELLPLQDAILQHIQQGHFSEAYLDLPHVFAWLCRDASLATWKTLATAGQDILDLILKQRAAAFRQAARAGRVDLVGAMWECVPPHQRDALWTACDHGALRYAISGDDLTMVAALLACLTPLERGEISCCVEVWETAALSAQGGMVCALNHWLPACSSGHHIALQVLVASGHRDAIAALLHGHPDQRNVLAAQNFEIFRLACRSGNPQVVQTLLRVATAHLDMLNPLLLQGLASAAASALDATTLQKVVELLEQAARPYGWDIFIGFGQPALTHACARGHFQLVRRVLGNMEAQLRWSFLQMRANFAGRRQTLLAAACATAQRPTVETLLALAGGPAEATAVIFQHNGAALQAATQSGDGLLVERLINLAHANPAAWNAWASDDNVQRVLRRAVASNSVDVWRAWRKVLPAQRLRPAMQRGGLVATALQEGAETTLAALLSLADGDPNLKIALINQAMSHGVGPAPLALALRHGHLAAVEVVLERLESSSRRNGALAQVFEDLCKTGLVYFRQQFECFTPRERDACLTASFWAALPLHANASVATYLMQQHEASFVLALAPLPEEALSMQQWRTARAIIQAAPAALQGRVVEAWGKALVRAAMDLECPEIWEFACQHLGRDATLGILAADDCKRYSWAAGAVHPPVLSFVVLTGGWLDDPQQFGALGRLAVQDLLRDDNVTLLRELLARYPHARWHPCVQPLLFPPAGAWEDPKPRIATYLYAHALAPIMLA